MSLNETDVPTLDELADLTPTFSVTVLRSHPDTDPAVAFRSLVAFLRTELEKQGRAEAVRSLGEVVLGESDQVPGLGSMLELGIDGMFVSVRERHTTPTWCGSRRDVIDVANQLTLVVRRGPFVAVHTPISAQVLGRWLRRFVKLYQYLPSAVLRGTFRGDGKTVWLHGVHRRRENKADSKTLGGLKIQAVLDEDEDASFAMSAAAIDHVPEDQAAVVRGRVTVSPPTSRIYWKVQVDLFTFLVATTETFDRLDKNLAAEPPEEQFPQLAIPEAELDNVRGAYDITIAEDDELLDLADDNGDLTERVELLRNAFIEVRAVPDSPALIAVVGQGGAEVGKVHIKPIARGDRFDLDVRFAEAPSSDAMARQIRDAIGDGDLLKIYYESGHKFDEYQINRQNQTAQPFPKQEFADFTGYRVTREKPAVLGTQAIHDAIGLNGDDSLFAWVVAMYPSGWLVCDDGAGEVADFLHLDGTTLTAIHVKGANSASLNRSVAVTAFQEVVAQAAKNVRLLEANSLADRFAVPRITRPACWFDGDRTSDMSGFVTALRARTTRDKTQVVIVQPHLLRSVHDAARTAAEAGMPTRESRSLTLLDALLRSARRSVTSLWDDLTVIGSE